MFQPCALTPTNRYRRRFRLVPRLHDTFRIHCKSIRRLARFVTFGFKLAAMKIIGLVGGVASGKSLAAKTLVEFGAVHLDADRTGHAVLAEDAAVRQSLV